MSDNRSYSVQYESPYMYYSLFYKMLLFHEGTMFPITKGSFQLLKLHVSFYGVCFS